MPDPGCHCPSLQQSGSGERDFNRVVERVIGVDDECDGLLARRTWAEAQDDLGRLAGQEHSHPTGRPQWSTRRQSSPAISMWSITSTASPSFTTGTRICRHSPMRVPEPLAVPPAASGTMMSGDTSTAPISLRASPSPSPSMGRGSPRWSRCIWMASPTWRECAGLNSGIAQRRHEVVQVGVSGDFIAAACGIDGRAAGKKHVCHSWTTVVCERTK